MPTNPLYDTLKLEAQKVLDAARKRHLFDVKLTAVRVEWGGPNKYVFYFRDDSLPPVTVSWVEGESFRDVFRAAILDRVSRMG